MRIQRSANWARLASSGTSSRNASTASSPTSNGTPANVSPTSKLAPVRLKLRWLATPGYSIVGGDAALGDHRVEVREHLGLVVEVGRRAMQLDEVERLHAEVLARAIVPRAEVLGGVVLDRLFQTPP